MHILNAFLIKLTLSLRYTPCYTDLYPW